MSGKIPISKDDLMYVVEKGRPKSVILNLNKFRSLLKFIEDLEGAVDLKRAKEEATEFESFDSFVKGLKKEGLF